MNKEYSIGLAKMSFRFFCKILQTTWTTFLANPIPTLIHFWGLPWELSGKEATCNAGTTGDSIWPLGREDPLEEEMAIHPSILAWEIPWTEETGGPQSVGSQRVGHDWETIQQQKATNVPESPKTWLAKTVYGAKMMFVRKMIKSKVMYMWNINT